MKKVISYKNMRKKNSFHKFEKIIHIPQDI